MIILMMEVKVPTAASCPSSEAVLRVWNKGWIVLLRLHAEYLSKRGISFWELRQAQGLLRLDRTLFGESLLGERRLLVKGKRGVMRKLGCPHHGIGMRRWCSIHRWVSWIVGIRRWRVVSWVLGPIRIVMHR